MTEWPNNRSGYDMTDDWVAYTVWTQRTKDNRVLGTTYIYLTA